MSYPTQGPRSSSLRLIFDALSLPGVAFRRWLDGRRYDRETERLAPLCADFFLHNNRAPSDNELALIAGILGRPSPVRARNRAFTPDGYGQRGTG